MSIKNKNLMNRLFFSTNAILFILTFYIKNDIKDKFIFKQYTYILLFKKLLKSLFYETTELENAIFN